MTSLGAGLAVPDWPLSYGKFIVVPMDWLRVPNFLAEHGHRVVAGTVGIMTMILAGLFWYAEKRPWVRFVALGAIGLVLVQALLGGLTVLTYLMDGISVSHALLGQSFFCVMVSLALFTTRNWQTEKPQIEDGAGTSTKKLCAILTGAIFLQLFFGAVMRHTASGLAVYDFPLSYGSFLPSLDETSIHNYNVDRQAIGLPDVAAWQIVFHMTHRLWAIGVCVTAILVARRILTTHKHSMELLLPLVAILSLLVVQVGLGALTIWTGRQPHVTTTHVGVGALILALSVILTLQSWRVIAVSANARESDSVASAIAPKATS